MPQVFVVWGWTAMPLPGVGLLGEARAALRSCSPGRRPFPLRRPPALV